MAPLTLNQNLLDADFSGLSSTDLIKGIYSPEITGDPDLLPERSSAILITSNPTFTAARLQCPSVVDLLNLLR
jgi:hypothetical protein